MIIMGLNFLGVLKRIKINFSLKSLLRDKLFKNKGKNMVYIGLINGLLPCEPM